MKKALRVLILVCLSSTRWCTSEEEYEEQDRCYQEADSGRCKAAVPRWFYNTSSKRCMTFLFGGCDSGENNFYNKSDCNQCCRDPIYGNCAVRPNGKNCSGPLKEKVRFNPDNQTCELYRTNCQDEDNSFKNMRDCYKRCGEFVVNPCILPIEPAGKRYRCNTGTIFRYGYNPQTQKCEKFQWSSCAGNINSFKTRKDAGKPANRSRHACSRQSTIAGEFFARTFTMLTTTAVTKHERS
uniref:Pancreatic trypsin inhibitor n=1 Tax=Rhipicephalus zambeziensis TaxID=60191 RepID=A0A224Y811_9ACAR